MIKLKRQPKPVARHTVQPNIPEPLTQIIKLRLEPDQGWKKFLQYWRYYRAHERLTKQLQANPFRRGRSQAESLAIMAAYPLVEVRHELLPIETRQCYQRWHAVFWKAQTDPKYFKRLCDYSAHDLFNYVQKQVGMPDGQGDAAELRIRLACFVIDITSARLLYQAIKRHPKKTAEDLSSLTLDKPYAIFPKPGGALLLLDKFDYAKFANNTRAITRSGGKSPDTNYPAVQLTIVDDGSIKQSALPRWQKQRAIIIQHERYHLLHDNYYQPFNQDLDYRYQTIKRLGVARSNHQSNCIRYRDSFLELSQGEVIAALSDADYPRNASALGLSIARNWLRKIELSLWEQNWSAATKCNVWSLYQPAYRAVLIFYPRYQALVATLLRYAKQHPQKLSLSQLETVLLTTSAQQIAVLEEWAITHYLPQYSYEKVKDKFTDELKRCAKKIHHQLRSNTSTRQCRVIFRKYLHRKRLGLSAFHSPELIQVLCGLLADCTVPYEANYLLSALQYNIEAWAELLTPATLQAVRTQLYHCERRLDKSFQPIWYSEDVALITIIRAMITRQLQYGGIDFYHHVPRAIAIQRRVISPFRREHWHYSTKTWRRLVRLLRNDQPATWKFFITTGDIKHCIDISTLFFIYQWCPDFYLYCNALEQLLFVLKHYPVSRYWRKTIQHSTARLLKRKNMCEQDYYFARRLQSAVS